MDEILWLIRLPMSKKRKQGSKKRRDGSPVNAVQDDRMGLLFLCLERGRRSVICDLFLPLCLRRFFAPHEKKEIVILVVIKIY